MCWILFHKVCLSLTQTDKTVQRRQYRLCMSVEISVTLPWYYTNIEGEVLSHTLMLVLVFLNM